MQHPLLQADEPLHQLEGRARRVLRLHGAVEERVALVVEHLHVVVAPLPSHQLVGIIRRRRDHHQNLARRGFDRHGGPDLAPHELLAEQLQPRVDRRDDVLPGDGQRVVAAVHVGALDGAVGVDLLDLHPLLALEQRFVGRLHAAHAHVVARLVRRVALDHVGRHLADVAQQVAADLARVAAHGTVDGVEAAEVALVEAQLLLLGEVARHDARRPWPHAGVRELAPQLLGCDADHLAQPRRVESLAVDLAVDDHQVVALAALHEVLAVAVEDLAARRVLHDVPQHVGPRQLGVARVEELEVGQAPDQHEEDEDHDPCRVRIRLKLSPPVVIRVRGVWR